ncbi:MAG: glycosyltransferase [Candidatus Pacebacteria bacterium]|nr:glycosyltransferase [Candidatus Paceibacterota bacterium]
MNHQKNIPYKDKSSLRPFNDITLIIPTLNEAENLPLLFGLLKKLYPDIKVIISDDGSNDGTKDITEKISKENKNIQLINRSKKKIHGICISVIDAIFETKTENFIVMDGDLQHPPEKIKEFKESFDKNYSLIIGTREKIKGWEFKRKVMSYVASLLGKISLFFRRKKIPKDILSGFFGGKTSLFQKIINKNLNKFEFESYKILFDFLKILPNKIETKEIPYIFGIRKKGLSKINKKHIIAFIKALFK